MRCVLASSVTSNALEKQSPQILPIGYSQWPHVHPFVKVNILCHDLLDPGRAAQAVSRCRCVAYRLTIIHSSALPIEVVVDDRPNH